MYFDNGSGNSNFQIYDRIKMIKKQILSFSSKSSTTSIRVDLSCEMRNVAHNAQTRKPLNPVIMDSTQSSPKRRMGAVASQGINAATRLAAIPWTTASSTRPSRKRSRIAAIVQKSFAGNVRNSTRLAPIHVMFLRRPSIRSRSVRHSVASERRRLLRQLR